MTVNTPQNTQAPTKSSRSIARYLQAVGRLSMGFIFFSAGLFGLLTVAGVLPAAPLPQSTDPASSFMGAVMASGYLFPLLKVTEIVVGSLLISNRFVPLALALIAPVIVNIVAFHVFLSPSGIPIAAVLLAIEIGLVWSRRGAYRSMLMAK